MLYDALDPSNAIVNGIPIKAMDREQLLEVIVGLIRGFEDDRDRRAKAMAHLVKEFVVRFRCDAESCTDPKLTRDALVVLTGNGCPCPECKPEED